MLYEKCEKGRDATSTRVLAFCVMPNHIHILAWAERGDSMAGLLQRIAAGVSRRLKPGGGFRKERPRVLPIFSRSVLMVKLDYLHNNPVRAGLVSDPGEWIAIKLQAGCAWWRGSGLPL